MNWELVGWFAGAFATMYMIKFVLMFIRKIFSKDTMTYVMDTANNAAARTSKKIQGALANQAKRINQRRKQKARMKREENERKKEMNRPVVVIR